MNESPSESKKAIKKKLNKKLEKITPKLPTNWIVLFVAFYPEYKGRESHLSNVRRGLSADETVVDRMVELVDIIKKPSKRK